VHTDLGMKNMIDKVHNYKSIEMIYWESKKTDSDL
jgi:hypothetical protein